MDVGERIIGGPYDSLRLAIARARPEFLHQHLLRCALENGVLRAVGGHVDVTVRMLADWTGFSVPTIRAWLRPHTNRSYRPMPRHAIRLVLHEFMSRDQSKYSWRRLLTMVSERPGSDDRLPAPNPRS